MIYVLCFERKSKSEKLKKKIIKNFLRKFDKKTKKKTKQKSLKIYQQKNYIGLSKNLDEDDDLDVHDHVTDPKMKMWLMWIKLSIQNGYVEFYR